MRIDPTLEDLIPIVAKLSEQFTSKESSSITYERANQLMEAVKYCIREYEEQACDMDSTWGTKKDQIIQTTSNITASKAYQKGYEMVLAKVKEIQKLYTELSMEFEAYGSHNLQDTVMKGILGFLLRYDAKFHPQNHILTMDYPVLGECRLRGRCGVDVIFIYLRCIQFEEEFLKAFPKAYVIEILTQYHNDYENLFINISEPVFTHFLCCKLINKPLIETEWTSEEYLRLEQYVFDQEEENLRRELKKAIIAFLQTNYEENPSMEEYFLLLVDDLSIRLQNAVRNHCMERIFHQD